MIVAYVRDSLGEFDAQLAEIIAVVGSVDRVITDRQPRSVGEWMLLAKDLSGGTLVFASPDRITRGEDDFAKIADILRHNHVTIQFIRGAP